MIDRRRVLGCAIGLALSAFSIGAAAPAGGQEGFASRVQSTLGTEAASADYVSRARWEWWVAWGPRIYITPAWQGRTQGRFNSGGVMREALRKSGVWLWSNTLYNQLRCHTDYAAWKPSWNLEAGRPNVGYWSPVRAACNPGGGAD